LLETRRQDRSGPVFPEQRPQFEVFSIHGFGRMTQFTSATVWFSIGTGQYFICHPVHPAYPGKSKIPQKKSNPGREVDPPAGAGRKKPHVDRWQTALVKTVEKQAASNMPNVVPREPLTICPFYLPPAHHDGVNCPMRAKASMETMVYIDGRARFEIVCGI